MEVLAQWPDPQAQGVLLDLVKRSANETHRVLALGGYVRLVDTNPGLPTQEKVRRYVEAMALSRRLEDSGSF